MGVAQTASAQAAPVPQGAAVKLVDAGFEFTEGPVWHQGALLFSDVPANTVYRRTPSGETTAFIKPSGRANGLAVDTSGHLLLAQHQGTVARWVQGTMTTLVQSYGGKRLNSPNDLVVASDGTIYFTDPPYGIDQEARELNFSGVYRLSSDGNLTLLTKALSRPNGIELAPDDSTLYVNDAERTLVWAYDITETGDIENRYRFAAPRDQGADGTTDGLEVDANGNVYTTGPGGVWVYGPNGTQRARIAVPKAPTNLAFGGEDRTTLYITARPHVYRVSVNVPGGE
ncbi:MAG: gluconolactonase [Bacteroidetes bacterium SW_9_63_38]|nr:MAG: gluconolactonase [Bacteroidetes bacterium SW_9_63_38]